MFIEPVRRKCRERGYAIPQHLRIPFKIFYTTNLYVTIRSALADHLAILTIIASCSWLTRQSSWWWLTAPAAWILIARFLRGLENLTHDGAHYNWVRPPARRMNDILTNFFAAYPCFTAVESMRGPHMHHHNSFGSELDPDLTRYEALGIEDLDRSNRLAFCIGVLRRVGTYTLGWWKAIGTNPRIVARSLAWHVGVLMLPSGLVLGFQSAAILWLVYWFGSFCVGLTLLRFFAESAKHEYRATSDVFGATISNIGRVHNLYFNPHGDGYHLLHHIAPGVPHHQLARAHAFLAANDPAYRVDSRQRTHVFELAPLAGHGLHGRSPEGPAGFAESPESS